MNSESERHDYSPIQPYWFYSKKVQDRVTWIPFSLIDVQHLDEAYAQSKTMLRRVSFEIRVIQLDREVIATNGNRYDVNLVKRIRTPVYWTDEPNAIRRSKWFYLPEQESRFIPFDEIMNETLEVNEIIRGKFKISSQLFSRIFMKKRVESNHGIPNMK